MGIQFDGVNPESKAKLDKIVSDGKVSQAEYNSLTPAEKEALEAGLAGKIGDDTLDRFKFTGPKNEKTEEKDDKAWYEKAWDVVKAPLAGIGAGAALGAGVGSIVPGLGTLTGAVVGGIAGLLMIGTTSCSGPLGDEPDIKIEDNSKTEVNVQLTVEVEQKIADIDNGKNDEIVALLRTIVEMLDKGNNISQQNNVMLTKILNALTTQNLDNADIKALLQRVLETLNNAIEENRELSQKQTEVMNAILAAINNLDSGISEKLLAIIDKIDSMGANNYQLLVDILNVIQEGNLENNRILEAILNKVIEGNEQNKDMDTKTHGLLTQILNKLDKMDASTQANFEAIVNLLLEGNDFSAEILDKLTQILAQLDKMDANQANFFAQVLAKFDKLDAGQQANLDKILEAITNNTAAINQNTVVAEATYNLVASLLDKLDELKDNSNVNVSAILDAIANISVGGGGNVDLSTIEQLLKDLLKSSEMNNKVLTSIEAKLEAVSITLGGIKVALGEGHESIIKKLDEILAKIPNGCHCDIDAILVKLDILIEEIKKNPDDDKKHEGILDDLEDLFN